VKIDDNSINRLKSALGYDSDKQLADLFGLAQSDFANRKQRGTLLDFVVEHALINNICVNWIITGHGEMYLKNDDNVFSQVFQLELMGELIERVEKRLNDLRKKMPPRSKRRLLLELYELSSREIEEERKENNVISIKDFLAQRASQIDNITTVAARVSG